MTHIPSRKNLTQVKAHPPIPTPSFSLPRARVQSHRALLFLVVPNETIIQLARTCLAAEANEATTRKAFLAVRLAQIEAERIAMLAEMELDDEAEEAEDEANSVNTLADVLMMSTADFGELGAPPARSPHSSDIEMDDETFCTIADLDQDYETLEKAARERAAPEGYERTGKTFELQKLCLDSIIAIGREEEERRY